MDEEQDQNPKQQKPYLHESKEPFQRTGSGGEQEPHFYSNKDLDSAERNPTGNEGSTEASPKESSPKEDSEPQDESRPKSQELYKGKGDNDKSFGGKLKQAASSATQGKRKFFLGGGVGGVLISIVFGIAAIVPFELVHIEKVLVGYEAKVEMRFEKKAAQSLMQKIICRQIQTGCKNDPADSKEQATKDDTDAATKGEKLTTEMDSYDLTNPDVQTKLAKVGINVETDGKGNVTALTDENGNDITDEIGTNDVLFNKIETALPEVDVGRLISFRPTLVDEAGATFVGVSDTDNDNVDKTIEDEVQNGASASEVQAASVEESGHEVAGDKSSSDASYFSDETKEAGDIGTAVDAVAEAEAAGETGEEATEAGVATFNLGDPLFLSTVASTGCGLEKDVAEAAADRVPEITTLLIRNGTNDLTLASQLQQGKMTSKELSAVMKLFNGDPSAPKLNSDKTPNESRLPFSDSEGWEEATGGPKGSGIPINISALPNANSGTSIVNEIASILGKAKVNYSCGIIDSKFGFVAQGLFGAFQFASDDFSLGASQIAITASIVAAQESLQHIVLPEIIDYFTPAGVGGTENSVQKLNNGNLGLNMAFGTYARKIGGVSETNAQANTQTTEANQSVAEQNAQQPWTTRTFALSNPSSLVSKIVDNLPIGLDQTTSNLASMFSNIPSILANEFSSIFLHSSVSAAQDTNPGEPYNVIQYGFSDSDVDKYDPIGNENYLFQTLSYGGRSEKRIDMLGNPNDYTDSPSGDGNNNDLLHCFVDSYTILALNPTDPNNAAVRQYCGDLGSFDMTQNDPTDIPGDSQVISIYCQALAGNPSDPGCQSAISKQVNDDVGHFRQYLLDLHVMNDYESLTSNQ